MGRGQRYGDGSNMARMNAHGKCRDCGEPLIWAETLKGKKIPFDPSPTAQGDWRFDLVPVGGKMMAKKVNSDRPGHIRHQCKPAA